MTLDVPAMPSFLLNLMKGNRAQIKMWRLRSGVNVIQNNVCQDGAVVLSGLGFTALVHTSDFGKLD